MRPVAKISEKAKGDLEIILQYIDLDNPTASKKVEAAIFKTIDLICDFPFIAPLHQAILAGVNGVRRLPVVGSKTT